MIKYNKNTNTFDSMFNQHPISEISTNRMYGWIAAKEISIKDFNVWIEYKEQTAKHYILNKF